MIHNDVLRSLRYLLEINDAKLIELIKLGGLDVSKADIATYLKKEDEEGFVRCPDEVLAHCLDGLVYFKRGKDESRPALPIELPVTNNIVMKKLRVAFELKEEDLHAILKAVDFPVSKPELSALFRKVGHSNYRPCGDQLLRNFLKGLTLRVRG
ncbi:DUF1456 domain-containing protein [Pseudomonas sp. FFUP_PS_473]|jgi:uncharacterized protein YehS (DUF1456 family)|uniref:DUF1456 family protein n=1 Tax=Pseudomonas laurentiana TaxID=2364649 RepID=A0A6I5RLD0_9PSED|nr:MULTISPECIES: DUF1456 family protein [Pseudomonas]MEE3633105.1 DUF1456 family protein [Pseudomonas sp. AL 58]ATR82172.1 DUF1456 domain-containing protein [Pseudomonas sp. HLS-6]NES08727.1 DUF1456 family protein [Pseudomonas laurentiana]PLP87818.1 DUF1456 domain-containing protein [Pseudomonas sp. FFUP_PS_473]WJM98590.1 DUF1456 family protein [Pseudomonas defluvii]